MAGAGARGPRRAAGRKRPARPVLGNDPFERGAAPRAPEPRPPPSPPQARLDRLEARVEEALSDAEERLEQVLGRGGAGRYAAELREALVRLWPALRERLRPIASLAGALASPGPLDSGAWIGGSPSAPPRCSTSSISPGGASRRAGWRGSRRDRRWW